ncbi:MAG: hypothetical protein U0S48_06670 [Solirubrobacteraceae bacterium]
MRSIGGGAEAICPTRHRHPLPHRVDEPRVDHPQVVDEQHVGTEALDLRQQRELLDELAQRLPRPGRQRRRHAGGRRRNAALAQPAQLQGQAVGDDAVGGVAELAQMVDVGVRRAEARVHSERSWVAYGSPCSSGWLA